MRRSLQTVAVFAGFVLTTPFLFARDFGVSVFPIHQGKFTSSLLYGYLKQNDDFDTRGRADFESSITGAQFTYGITDQIALSLKGGALVDPNDTAQGVRYEGRSGYLYGLDISQEVFPATQSARPGLQIIGGATGFLVPYTEALVNGVSQVIDQDLTGVEYHGSLVATWKWSVVEPYFGVRLFGSSVKWRDNDSQPDFVSSIVGHAHGNASLVVGAPLQIAKDVRFEVQGSFFNETLISTGFTIATY